MITLIISNLQSDYVSGTVSIRSMKNALIAIKKYIESNKDNIDKIVFAIEWHPYNHCSFKKYGGELSSHCVAYTPGACIEPKLLKLVHRLGINYAVCTRGEYENVNDTEIFNDIEYVSDHLTSRIFFNSVVEVNADTDFVICGESKSIENSLECLIEHEIYPKILIKGIGFSDNGQSFHNKIKELNLKKI